MNFYEKIIEKYDIILNSDQKVLILPHNKYEWHVVRDNDEEGILLSLDDIACLCQHFAQFNETLTGIENFNSEEYKTYILNKK